MFDVLAHVFSGLSELDIAKAPVFVHVRGRRATVGDGPPAARGSTRVVCAAGTLSVSAALLTVVRDTLGLPTRVVVAATVDWRNGRTVIAHLGNARQWLVLVVSLSHRRRYLQSRLRPPVA